MPDFAQTARLMVLQIAQPSMNTIPGAIPAIRADELLASYWRRLLDLNGMGQSRCFASMTIGGPWRQLSLALPLHLNAFWDTCGTWLNLSVDQGIELHTLFPIFACGLPDVRREHLRLRMQGGGLGPRRPSLPLLLAEHLPYVVSICDQCTREEEAALGFSYWHRKHNCPGVFFCVKHSQRLIYFSTKANVPSPLPLGDAGKSETENDIRLSNAYSELLHLTGDGIASFRADLKQRALNLNDCKFSKRVNTTRLAQLLSDLFAHGFATESLSRLVSDEMTIRDAIANIFASRPTVHPLWVALLHAGLPSLCGQPKKVVPCARQGLDEQALLPALLTARSLTQASHFLGISVTTLATVARRNEISFSARPSKVDARTRNAIETALITGGAISEIAACFGLGVGSIYRALASRPTVAQQRNAHLQALAVQEHRSSWQRLLPEHDGVTLSEARRKAPALWAWLYRNDRQWLQTSTRPAPSREVGSAKRRSRTRLSSEDRRQLARALVEVGDGRTTDGRTPRMTRTRIAHNMGWHGSGQTARCLAGVFAAPAGEPVTTYVQRRLRSAIDAILESGTTLRGWRVQRSARLRDQTIVAADIDLSSFVEQVMLGLNTPGG
jgi:hypothetical protein